jgi:transmembrane sensor
MTTNRIYDEAADWLVRQEDDAMDWSGFTAWLEADPRHRAAVDELAIIGAQLDDHWRQPKQATSAPVLAANDPNPVRWGRWAGLGGGAAAAALAIVFLALQPANRQLKVEDYRSAPGRSVEVALGGGKVVLAPVSHLIVEGENANLEGTAYFDVPHRPGRTLTITAGEFRVTDVGTRFSVANEANRVDVEVADGSLSVASARLAKPIGLSTGNGLRANRSSGTVRLVNVDPQQVASWRSGRLQFDASPLALVARDVSRYSGARVTVDPTIAGQPFSGVITIHHGEAPARTLAQILSLEIKQVDGTTRLEPRRR